ALTPFGAAVAERAEEARIPVRLAALRAEGKKETPLAGGAIEGLGLRVARRRRDDARLRHHTSSMISVAAEWRAPRRPPVPCARARSQFATCTAGCASPRNCRTASMILVIPPRLAGWLLQRPPPSVFQGSRPIPEMRLPS